MVSSSGATFLVPSGDLYQVESRFIKKKNIRVAYEVPQCRKYILSGYPSEPILAEVAAHRMREVEKSWETDWHARHLLSHVDID
jgi:hypothetical protein